MVKKNSSIVHIVLKMLVFVINGLKKPIKNIYKDIIPEYNNVEM